MGFKTHNQRETVKHENEGQVYISPWIPNKSGPRTFRLLPDVQSDGTLMTEFDPTLDRTVATITVHRIAEAWVKAMVDGQQVDRKVLLDPFDPWGNPVWKLVSKTTEKGSKERRMAQPKQVFHVNVFDLSPVLFQEDGTYLYPNEKNVFCVTANNKLVAPVTSRVKAKPLNQVRILTGSAGDPGGKHLLSQFANLEGTVTDSEGMLLALYELNLIMKTTGEGEKTQRTLQPTAFFNPIEQMVNTDGESILTIPRYDLATWTNNGKGWDYDAIERILAGEDFNEIVEEYDLKLFPELKAQEEVDVDYEDPATYTRSKRQAVADLL